MPIIFSPCARPGCRDEDGNRRLTTQNMCDPCRGRPRRELSWIVVEVDGGAPTTIDTLDAGAGYGLDGHWTRISLDASAAHVVIISRTVDDVYVNGVIVYDGDETKGIQVIDGSHYGWKSSDRLTNTDRISSLQSLLGLAPALVAIALGTLWVPAPGQTPGRVDSPRVTGHPSTGKRLRTQLRTGTWPVTPRARRSLTVPAVRLRIALCKSRLGHSAQLPHGSWAARSDEFTKGKQGR